MENKIIKKGIKNTFFVLLAQTLKFLLGITRSLILPIILGVTNFGYWQVYLLYVSYMGIFSLGFNDGIYLKYGKYNYDNLPKPVFRTSIKLFIFAQILMTFIVSMLILFEPDTNKRFAMFFATINIPISGLTGVLIYVLQITNQIKKYSFYTILDNIIILSIVLAAFVFKIDQFILIILGDILSKLVVLLMMIYSCRDLIVGKGIAIDKGFKELLDNVRIGIKLMLANFAGMLVLGYGRFIIERFETVEVYGTYAFSISTINLILVFITAIGLVIYPTLSRIEDYRYGNYFKVINQILKISAFILLIVYFPLKVFIGKYLTDYYSIFSYLPIIFAIVFIQSKMQILVNPFYKLLRKEKAMLKANITGVLIAIMLVSVAYLITRSVTMVALSTFIAMMVRLYLSEIYLMKYLEVSEIRNIAFEVFGVGMFIFLAYQSNLLIGFIGYSTIIITCLCSQLKSIKTLKKYFFER